MRPGISTCNICGSKFPTDGYKTCPACRADEKKTNQRMRKCHDCGSPTFNYRCSACWKKIRKAEHLIETVLDEMVEHHVWL